MQKLFRLMVNAHEQMKFATLSLYQACKETKDVVGKRGIEEYLKILSVQERWLDLVKKNNKVIKTKQ